MATLYVVGTPIGNLSDASPRMVETLRQCALIAAEDTRVTAKLCNHFAIQTSLTSCHQYNERTKSETLISRIVAEDQCMALVTDAGMPCISDPGYFLVAAAWAAGMSVLSVPGPSAFAAALSVSGFDTRAFAFYGFLPRQKKELKDKLTEIARGIPIAVLYESPHRVLALLAMVAELFDSCQVCVCCDLTKLYELTYRGSVHDVIAAMSANPNVEKGEYCIVLDLSEAMASCPAVPEAQPGLEARLMEQLMDGQSLRQAVTTLTGQGAKRNDLYQASLRLKSFLDAWQDGQEA